MMPMNYGVSWVFSKINQLINNKCQLKVDPMDPNRGETVYETKPVRGLPNTYDSVMKLDNVRTEHYETRFRCHFGMI